MRSTGGRQHLKNGRENRKDLGSGGEPDPAPDIPSDRFSEFTLNCTEQRAGGRGGGDYRTDLPPDT